MLMCPLKTDNPKQLLNTEQYLLSGNPKAAVTANQSKSQLKYSKFHMRELRKIPAKIARETTDELWSREPFKSQKKLEHAVMLCWQRQLRNFDPSPGPPPLLHLKTNGEAMASQSDSSILEVTPFLT